jgi:hypothetical protein
MRPSGTRENKQTNILIPAKQNVNFLKVLKAQNIL